MIDAKGGCHCGAVRFSVALPPEPVPALDCNCSVCRRSGYLHVIVAHNALSLDEGREALTRYRFGTGKAEHLFCRHCGVKSFYQPRSHPNCWSINARCLDQAVELEIEKFDGVDWERSKPRLDGAQSGG